jgi:hypothetical protein
MAHVLHTVDYRVRCSRCGATWTEIDEDTSPSDLRPGARHQHSCRCCGTMVEALVIGNDAAAAPTRVSKRAPAKARPRRRVPTTRVSG